MSEQIKHECGIALIRLRKPLEYYRLKYGTWQYGVNKLYLMMEKQHNRGQDGAGAVGVKVNMSPGQEYIFRHRSIDPNPIRDVFAKIFKEFSYAQQHFPQAVHDPTWAKANLPFAGELYLGHLRYGTYGRNSVESTHPVMRQNNWRSRNLALAGNFNLTNVDELFNLLVGLGQFPKGFNDTVTVLEKVGHFLDEENELLFRQYKNEGFAMFEEMMNRIQEDALEFIFKVQVVSQEKPKGVFDSVPQQMIHQEMGSLASRIPQSEGGEPAAARPPDAKQAPIEREAPKVGRNDPCPCGSGKKYKKCCGA